MSAMIDSQMGRVRDAWAFAEVALPLFRARPTDEVLESLRRTVDNIERLGREISENLGRSKEACRGAANLVAIDLLREGSEHIAALLKSVEGVIETYEILRPMVAGEMASLCDRLVAAESSTRDVVLDIQRAYADAVAELEDEARTDPVTASLLDAPYDDEPFTERHRREVREALLSLFD